MRVTQNDSLHVRRTFGGDRLRVGREFKGWSKEELGRRSNLTGASIGQFERNETTPNIRTIEKLATVLEVPAGFLVATADTGASTGAYFRSLRATTLTERRRARAFVQYVHQFILALENYVVLPEDGLGRHSVNPKNDQSDIEEVAAHVRRESGLSATEPIRNVVRVLERGGILVVRNYSVDSKIDAFSVPFDDRSLVVLSSVKGKYDRSRFDAAHELGHLVMHDPDASEPKQRENQAHQFAAAFLMPANGIRHEFPTSLDWRAFLQLKQKWGASVAALLRRSRDLKRMSDAQYRNAMKVLSARGWRREEPGNLRPEEPALLSRAVEIATKEGHTIDDLAMRAALPVHFVRQLLAQATDPRPAVDI